MRPKGVQIERPLFMGIKSGNGVNSSQVISTFIFKSCTISNLHKRYVTRGKSLIDQSRLCCAQISKWLLTGVQELWGDKTPLDSGPVVIWASVPRSMISYSSGTSLNRLYLIGLKRVCD